MAKRIDPSEWIGLQTAATRRGVTRQAIENLIKRGKLETLTIDIHQFVRVADVENYTPELGGRPRKVESEKKRAHK
jgi:hypothetical protein